MNIFTEKKILKFMEENNGYFIMKKIGELGLSKQTCFEIVRTLNLIKVAPGIYTKSVEYADDLFILYSRNPGIIFSGQTALYIHRLIDNKPPNPTCTVKFGYNATNIKRKGIKVYSERDDHFYDGVIDIRTENENIIRCYDLDRTICQMIKDKKDYPIDVFVKAIKTYMSREDKNIDKLCEYSNWMKNNKLVMTYIEVLNEN